MKVTNKACCFSEVWRSESLLKHFTLVINCWHLEFTLDKNGELMTVNNSKITQIPL